MEYKYAGKSFEIEWNDDGKFECRELGVICDSPEEVRARVRELAEKEQKLPRVKVLMVSNGKMIEGFSNLKIVPGARYYGNRTEVWVSWKEKNNNERRKKYTEDVFTDTPENRAKIAEYCNLLKQIDQLKNKASDMEDTFEIVTGVNI